MSDTKLPEGFDWRRITPEDSPRTPEDLFEDLNYLNLSKADLSVGDPAFFFPERCTISVVVAKKVPERNLIWKRVFGINQSL